MLQKYRHLASINDGLCSTKEAMNKGMLVTRAYNEANGEWELSLPTSATDKIYGFVDKAQDNNDHVSLYYDEIEVGTKALVWTLVPNEAWVTDQVTGTFVVGDTAGIDASNKGKVVKATENALFEVVEVFEADTKMPNYSVALRVL